MQDIFIQTEDQRAILETIRRFNEEEVTPRAAELDAQVNPEDGFSWEIVEAADKLGLRTMTLSEAYGGLGTEPLTTAMVIEELSKGDLGIGISLGQTLKLAQIMEELLNEEQKQRVLPEFAQNPRGGLD